jgi:large subunit ribosomal protein L10
VVADQMTGPLIYGFSEDAVAAAKVVADFAKTNDKLVIRGGAFGGKALDIDGVKQLANIPSKEVLLAQCAACSCRLSRVQPLCWALWRPRRAKALPKRQQKQLQPECSAKPTNFRKSKWHSIKTHS